MDSGSKVDKEEYDKLFDETIDTLNAEQDFSGVRGMQAPVRSSNIKVSFKVDKWFQLLVILLFINILVLGYLFQTKTEGITREAADEEIKVYFGHDFDEIKPWCEFIDSKVGTRGPGDPVFVKFLEDINQQLVSEGVSQELLLDPYRFEFQSNGNTLVFSQP